MREVVLARGRRPVCVPERRLPGIIAGSGGTVVEVREVSAEEEVRAVSPVVRQLRTHLSEEELVSAVERMRPEGSGSPPPTMRKATWSEWRVSASRSSSRTRRFCTSTTS
jgi:hypothetical protein